MSPVVSKRYLPVAVRGLIGLGVLALSIGFFALLFVTKKNPERSEIVVRPLSVHTVVLSAQPIAKSYPGHGAVRAMRSVDIPAQLSARVEARPSAIEDGARVRKGDLIVQLEQQDFRNRLLVSTQRLAAIDAQLAVLDVEEKRLQERLTLAEAEVQLAQDDLDRANTAVRGGGGIQVDIDRAAASLKRTTRESLAIRQSLESVEPRRAQIQAERIAEERNRDLAQSDLDRTTIRSPIDGFLQSVDAEADEWVSPGQRVARVVALDRLEIPLEIPLSAASTIRVGDSASLTADSAAPARWSGTVSRISPEATSSTRSMIVFVEIEQALDPDSGYIEPTGGGGGAILLPGQYVVARVRSSTARNQLIVPRRAIVEDYVYVAETIATDGGDVRVVKRRPITVAEHIEGSFPAIDPHESQWAVIESGLDEGDRVVVSNLDELRDSLAIEIAPAPRRKASTP